MVPIEASVCVYPNIGIYYIYIYVYIIYTANIGTLKIFLAPIPFRHSHDHYHGHCVNISVILAIGDPLMLVENTASNASFSTYSVGGSHGGI